MAILWPDLTAYSKRAAAEEKIKWKPHRSSKKAMQLMKKIREEKMKKMKMKRKLNTVKKMKSFCEEAIQRNEREEKMKRGSLKEAA